MNLLSRVARLEERAQAQDDAPITVITTNFHGSDADILGYESSGVKLPRNEGETLGALTARATAFFTKDKRPPGTGGGNYIILITTYTGVKR